MKVISIFFKASTHVDELFRPFGKGSQECFAYQALRSLPSSLALTSCRKIALMNQGGLGDLETPFLDLSNLPSGQD